MQKTKSYKELTFTDDFMFCKIMVTYPDLCKELLEIILGKKIRNIICHNSQQTISMTSDAKGIRLDVYLEDDTNTVYDIEMQTTTNKNLPKRTRYYQGMLDLNMIERGEDYKKLKNSYVIFICTFDPFGKNEPVYTFENRCNERLDLKLNDGCVKMFLNPDGDAAKLTSREDLQALFRFLKHNEASDGFTRRLKNAVAKAVAHGEWEVEYMTLLMRDQENREKGRAEGRAEGLESLVNVLKPLLPDFQAVFLKIREQKQYADVTEEQVRKYYYG